MFCTFPLRYIFPLMRLFTKNLHPSACALAPTFWYPLTSQKKYNPVLMCEESNIFYVCICVFFYFCKCLFTCVFQFLHDVLGLWLWTLWLNFLSPTHSLFIILPLWKYCSMLDMLFTMIKSNSDNSQTSPPLCFSQADVPDRHPLCVWGPATDPQHFLFNCSWLGAYPSPNLTWVDGGVGGGQLHQWALADGLSLRLNRSELWDGQTLRCHAQHPVLADTDKNSCSFTFSKSS